MPDLRTELEELAKQFASHGAASNAAAGDTCADGYDAAAQDLRDLLKRHPAPAVPLDQELDKLAEKCRAAHGAEPDQLKRCHLGGAAIAYRDAARRVRQGPVGPDDYAFTLSDGRGGVLRADGPWPALGDDAAFRTPFLSVLHETGKGSIGDVYQEAVRHDMRAVEVVLRGWVERAGVTPEEFAKFYGYTVEREHSDPTERFFGYRVIVKPVQLTDDRPRWSPFQTGEAEIGIDEHGHLVTCPHSGAPIARGACGHCGGMIGRPRPSDP